MKDLSDQTTVREDVSDTRLARPPLLLRQKFTSSPRSTHASTSSPFAHFFVDHKRAPAD